MKINYFTERNVRVPHLRRQIIARWIRQVANEMGKTLGELSYKFTNDAGVLHLSGIDDKTPEEERLMHFAEDRAIVLLHRLIGDRPLLAD